MGYPHEICSIGRLKIGDAKSALISKKKFAQLRKVFACMVTYILNVVEPLRIVVSMDKIVIFLNAHFFVTVNYENVYTAQSRKYHLL